MYRKKAEEIELIVEGGRILGGILAELADMAKPGVSAADIDAHAEKKIREAGGLPAFKGYQPSSQDTPFPATVCFSLNAEVVHGIPGDRVIKEGDIVSIDVGMQYPANSGLGQNGNGFFTDTAITVAVGNVDPQVMQLLAVTKKSLYLGIAQMKKGNTVGQIGKAVQNYIKPQGYGIVRDLSGHGVGHQIHEDPWVPNYYHKDLDEWELHTGVVLAVEPMITMGDWKIRVADDGWAIVTKDGSLSAHFEHTVVVTKDGPVVATQRPGEKINL